MTDQLKHDDEGRGSLGRLLSTKEDNKKDRGYLHFRTTFPCILPLYELIRRRPRVKDVILDVTGVHIVCLVHAVIEVGDYTSGLLSRGAPKG
jgi:hypothetical protein